MCVVDYLLANTDRHDMNWGFQRTAPDWKITGLHPLFDHNNAFDIEELQGHSTRLSVLDYYSTERKGLLHAAEKMINYADFKFTKPIPKSAFKLFGKNEKFIREAFLQRCETLGIKVNISKF